MREAVIVSAVRTPLGAFGGSLSEMGATTLGGLVIAEAVRRSEADFVAAMDNDLNVSEALASGRLSGDGRRAGRGLQRGDRLPLLGEDGGRRAVGVDFKQRFEFGRFGARADAHARRQFVIKHPGHKTPAAQYVPRNYCYGRRSSRRSQKLPSIDTLVRHL